MGEEGQSEEVKVTHEYSNGTNVSITVRKGAVWVEDDKVSFWIDSTVLRFAVRTGRIDVEECDFLYGLD